MQFSVFFVFARQRLRIITLLDCAAGGSVNPLEITRFSFLHTVIVLFTALIVAASLAALLIILFRHNL